MSALLLTLALARARVPCTARACRTVGTRGLFGALWEYKNHHLLRPRECCSADLFPSVHPVGAPAHSQRSLLAVTMSAAEDAALEAAMAAQMVALAGNEAQALQRAGAEALAASAMLIGLYVAKE